jgi:hypothetical protein
VNAAIGVVTCALAGLATELTVPLLTINTVFALVFTNDDFGDKTV